MKQIILILCFLLCGKLMIAQGCCPYMTTTQVIPQYPSSTDNIKIVTGYTSPNLGTKISASLNSGQNSFSITSCYFQDIFTSPQVFTDTFVVGQLPIGTYTVFHRAYRSSSTQTCTQATSNTIITTFYVGTTSLPEMLKKDEVKLYPNPVKDKLNIEFKDVNLMYRLTITNPLGQVIYSSFTKNLKEEMNLSFLATGIYYLKAETEKGQEVFKIVKE